MLYSFKMQLNHRLIVIAHLVVGLILLSLGEPMARIIHLPQEYKTIQQAIDAAQSGDQIRLAASIYKENIVLKPGVGISGEDALTTLIIGSPWLSLPIVTMADKSSLEEVTIKGAKAGSKAAIYINGGAPHISNCIITDNQTLGILIEGKTAPSIEHNKISKNHTTGIKIINATPLILANELFDNQGMGILAIDAAAQIKDNHIYRNFRYGINSTSTLTSPELSDSPQLTIIGNTIEDNRGGEILCQNSSPVIQGNTIANKGGLAILLFNSNAVIKANHLTSGGRPVIRIASGNPIIEENTISGVLRLPIIGESKGGINNNKIEIKGPQFKMLNGG